MRFYCVYDLFTTYFLLFRTQKDIQKQEKSALAKWIHFANALF